jgi:hypothetical protein
VLEVINELPETMPVAISLVWVQVLGGDNRQAAQSAASQISYPGVRHFYDPQLIAAREMAELLGGQGSYAWDTYLAFSADAEWEEKPPEPVDWVHQLDNAGWAPEQRRKTGETLIKALQTMIMRA